VNVVRSDGAVIGIAAVAGHEISEDAMRLATRARFAFLAKWQEQRQN
jgi:hypothetical protein